MGGGILRLIGEEEMGDIVRVGGVMNRTRLLINQTAVE